MDSHPISQSQLRELEKKAQAELRDKGDNIQPIYYSLAGSHMYGMDGPGSDFDIRGFHLVDGFDYMLLDQPKEQFVHPPEKNSVLNKPWEMVSYELKKFTKLVYNSNFNVIELLYSPAIISNPADEIINRLRNIIDERLPLDLHIRYQSMASEVYRKQIQEGDPTAKTYLHVIRALLASKNVRESQEVIPDIEELSERVLGDSELISELIESKAYRQQCLNENVEKRAKSLIENLQEEMPRARPSAGFKKELNEWMVDTRKLVPVGRFESEVKL